MGVTLFEHNRAAYESALSLMKRKKKAAVIHPTGTGKSFLAFQLCADDPDKTVCWLSPSEYIYRTQMENWKRAGGSEIRNVRFFTYARMMLMQEEELEEIQPDYIVLDEFHRCGAKMWGQGVQRLLRQYPYAPLLGLSATNIRYLDGQRDMASELFDGCVASELTLGEAIVRGILNPPQYVLSVYAFQKDLERYEAKIRTARRTVPEDARKALEALRRALELADGMDEMFQKYMPDAHGKYIVFCANYSHMQEMVEKVPEWFCLVDPAPHVYTIYSKEPETDRSFAEFKEDCSSHLKLLFSIDMLNEGIHVEDISGVILLRPTVSPIIYKQQIGRAFSASKKNHAVIFDIVLNIENLSSIGALEEEMQTVIDRYDAQGRTDEVVNRHFQIIAQVQDCVRLFKRLEGSLSASWDAMYEAAEAYYQNNGSLKIPKRYTTQEGLSLGSWLDTQRRVYAGKIPGILTDGQIHKLEAIGMQWQGAWESAWDRNFAEAEAYYREHKNLLVKAKENVHGIALGQWLAQLRVYKKKQVPCLTPERIAALESIGMVWDVSQYLWEQNYTAAQRYYEEHGNLDVPADYVDEEGVSLGRWITKMRREKRNDQGDKRRALQFLRLEEIGMSWESKWDAAWEKSYHAAVRYLEDHGNLNVPVAYVTEEGIRLGKWLRHQREAKDTLSGERKRKLDLIGMEWEPENSWNYRYDLAKQYYEEHGSLKMPGNFVVEGVWLARWLNEQNARLNKGGSYRTGKLLTPEQAGKLKSLGMQSKE